MEQADIVRKTRLSGDLALLHRSFTFAIITPIKPCHCNDMTLLSSRRKTEILLLIEKTAKTLSDTSWVYTHNKMNKLGFLFILCAICAAVSTSDEGQGDEFIKSLDADNSFEGQASGLASNPIAAAILNVDKNQYPHLFDTLVSSSIDNLQSQTAPRNSVFDAANFGFDPIASQGFYPYGKLAEIKAQPQQPNTHIAPNTQQLSPLRYDIRTIHDPNYKVYKPEENEDGNGILEALKQNPDVASYFQPTVINNPVKYQQKDLIENFDGNQNYKQNPYIAGPARIRRYTGRRSREHLRQAEDDEDDPYNYKAEYNSKPKAFDESPYSSPYKKKKGAKDDYEYPYSYDSGYDHKEYDRIKDLSEKQAAEIKQNPGNCKEVKKDGMSCMQCKDPKTGGNYESCSYVAEPKSNQYAYSKENKFNSNDEPNEPENENDNKSAKQKTEKFEKLSKDDTAPQKFTSSETESNEKPYSSYKEKIPKDDSGEKFKAYYVHTSQPKSNEKLRAESKEENSEEDKPKSYDYKKALPEFYTDNEPKKDVEHVLAEFKKKDRSSCKKVQKNAMTCYQCIDKTGLKNEECMFVSESAPKKSHVAYQELKEFTSKPATLDSNEGAESQTVTTSAPVQKSAAYVAANDKKSKRKKTQVAPPITKSKKVKRSEGSQLKPDDDSNLAPPEEFAGAESQGAFWAETIPRYSATLGVSLPEYMLARSEHEDSFDEAVTGA